MNDIFDRFYRLVDDSFISHAAEPQAVARAKTLIARHAALLEELSRSEAEAEESLRRSSKLRDLLPATAGR
jgi:hypothetical protein